MDERTTTIFRARRIITMTPDEPEALAVLGEQIVAAGAAEGLAERFPEAERVDFGDAVVVPGFYDAHMHLASMSNDLLNVDLSSHLVGSITEIITRLAEAAGQKQSGQWILGSRYDDGKVTGGLLTRDELDEVSVDQPILVRQVAGHWGIVNSKALELGGLNDASEPPSGGEYGRDANGRLNGVLYERALVNFASPTDPSKAIIPGASLEDRLRGLEQAVRMLHAAGITSINDAAVRPRDIELFQEAERRGLLGVRVNMLLRVDHFDDLRRMGLRNGFGSNRLRLNGVKAFVDGAIGGRTCLLEEPYEGSDDHGMQVASVAELAETARMAHETGTRLGVHANGDRAIALLLDQLEAAQAARPRPELRHRIEHCSVITEEILQRMKRLGAIAVPFATYVHYHAGNLLKWYGAERAERMFAHRAFLDAGVAVAGSSDYPCGPFEPLLAMQSCVTRVGHDGAEIGLSQRITPVEALGLYTTGAALASDEQHVKGRLAPGYLADFAVLGEDPLTTSPDRLAAIPVRATYVGGKEVWAAEPVSAVR